MKREADGKLRIARSTENCQVSRLCAGQRMISDSFRTWRNRLADTYAGLISEEDQVRVVEHSYSQANLRKSLNRTYSSWLRYRVRQPVTSTWAGRARYCTFTGCM